MHQRQAELLESAARIDVVVAGRRGGKSEGGAMKKLLRWQQLAREGTKGVAWIVTPTYDLSKPLWRKLMRLTPKGWMTDRGGSENRPEFMEFGRGIRVEFKSADRPQSLVAEGLVDLWVDEAQDVPLEAWHEVLPALMDFQAPALLSGTPNGRGNWFYRMAVRGMDPQDTEVRLHRWTSWENPYLDQGEVRRMQLELSDRMYRQEILAEFLEDEGTVFRGVREAATGLVPAAPAAVLGVDLAKVQDFTVIHGLTADGRTCWWERFKDISWPLQKARIQAAVLANATDAGQPVVVLDSTGVGDPVFDDLAKAGLNVHGFKFTNPSKQQLVEALAIGLEQGQVWLPAEPVLLNELEAFTFSVAPSGVVRYGAPEGVHDDTVMALGLAWWGLTTQARRAVPRRGPVRWN